MTRSGVATTISAAPAIKFISILKFTITQYNRNSYQYSMIHPTAEYDFKNKATISLLGEQIRTLNRYIYVKKKIIASCPYSTHRQ